MSGIYLSSLTISNGTLSPAFDPFISDYSANVSSASIILMASNNSIYGDSAIKVNNTCYDASNISIPINLNVGINTISIQTCFSCIISTTPPYILTLNRPPPQSIPSVRSFFSDNSRVFYKPHSLAAGGTAGVRNSRLKAKRT